MRLDWCHKCPLPSHIRTSARRTRSTILELVQPQNNRPFRVLNGEPEDPKAPIFFDAVLAREARQYTFPPRDGHGIGHRSPPSTVRHEREQTRVGHTLQKTGSQQMQK